VRPTPVRSLEGNGIAEAFGKEFKCDHVRLNVRPDAATVTTQGCSVLEMSAS